MKKILLLVLILLVAGTSFSFAKGLGIGIAAGLNQIGGLPNSMLLSLKLPEIPFLLGLGLNLTPGVFGLGVTADWWMYQTHLVGILNLYLGLGLFLDVQNEQISFGGRLPVGLQVWVIDPLELFLEVAPTLTLVGTAGIQIPNVGFQGAFGIRFWF
ncbi:MAG: hypothetical protein JXR70_11475 [Spirochaetales bacterium]|nr:hypothetical protein [Spirochaetales bacterium]